MRLESLRSLAFTGYCLTDFISVAALDPSGDRRTAPVPRWVTAPIPLRELRGPESPGEAGIGNFCAFRMLRWVWARVWVWTRVWVWQVPESSASPRRGQLHQQHSPLPEDIPDPCTHQRPNVTSGAGYCPKSVPRSSPTRGDTGADPPQDTQPAGAPPSREGCGGTELNYSLFIFHFLFSKKE